MEYSRYELNRMTNKQIMEKLDTMTFCNENMTEFKQLLDEILRRKKGETK